MLNRLDWKMERHHTSLDSVRKTPIFLEQRRIESGSTIRVLISFHKNIFFLMFALQFQFSQKGGTRSLVASFSRFICFCLFYHPTFMKCEIEGKLGNHVIVGMFAVLIEFEEVETWWFISHWKVVRIPKKSENISSTNLRPNSTNLLIKPSSFYDCFEWFMNRQVRAVTVTSSNVLTRPHFIFLVSKTSANRAKKRGTKWKKTKWSH